jgi:hypothetical protein
MAVHITWLIDSLLEFANFPICQLHLGIFLTPDEDTVVSKRRVD